MKIQIEEINWLPQQKEYEVAWCDMDIENHFEVFYIGYDRLLLYVIKEELNIISPNYQQDFTPYTINPKRALEEFEEDIIKDWIKNKTL
jgi:hypothetical protein